MAGCSASTASGCCPTTACSTSSGTSLPGPTAAPALRGRRRPVGVSICEDAWAADGPDRPARRRRGRPRRQHQRLAVQLGQGRVPAAHRSTARAAQSGATIAYVNQVGGQDELVFDGDSMVVAADGALLARAPQFAEGLFVVDVEVPGARRGARSSAGGAGSALRRRRSPRPPLVPVGGDRRRCPRSRRSGTRWCSAPGDFVRKNGFSDVVIGLSGGIDSSLVAAIAVEALGPEHVHGVLMPSRYSSDHSVTDAVALATNLGIEHRTVADRAGPRRPDGDAGAVVRRAAARPDRGEPPEPDPGGDPDGPVERLRLAVAQHRQQERVVGGLLHALRRLRRRVRGDQGRVQAPGLRAVPLPQRRSRAGRSSRSRCSPSRRRPSCDPTSATTRACRPTRCSIRSSPSTSRATCAAEEIVAAGSRPRDRRPDHPAGRPGRVQAPAVPARPAGHPKGFGKDRRLPIVNRYRR